MKICVAGQGAFGQKHLEVLRMIPDVEVVTLAGGNPKSTQAVAEEFGIPHWSSHDLDASLRQPGVEAVILATPTHLHAQQAIMCMLAGKHIMVEIPMADNLEDATRIVTAQQLTGLVAMAGHTRRFSPAHRYVHEQLRAGDQLRQLNIQTFFDRRTNINLAGHPRSWTDHLLWHHACHGVDMFLYMSGGLLDRAQAVQGPYNWKMQTAMDLGIVMTTACDAVCTMALSFHNKGRQGTTFRYICDNGTYICYYDTLTDGEGNPISFSQEWVKSGVEAQDREFLAAIREGREPNASVAQVLPAMQALGRLEESARRP